MKTIISILFAFVIFLGLGVTVNPASAENPCATNPCSLNPYSVKNVCSVAPAAENKPIRRFVMTDMEKVEVYGEELWTDTKLGTSGLSCSSCHPNGKDLRKGSYPKSIKMAGDILTLDQMINFCMVNPMNAKPLSWNHQKMTALAYYVSTHSNDPEKKEAVNPCGVNPCGANPCGANPCGVNPCGANPCGVNPCGVNPCGVNPCGANPCGVNPCGANPCAFDPYSYRAGSGR